MSEDTREKYLKIALVVFGVIFLLIYPLGLIWPSGWIWHGGQGVYYLQMICGIYAVLGIYLITAARTLARTAASSRSPSGRASCTRRSWGHRRFTTVESTVTSWAMFRPCSWSRPFCGCSLQRGNGSSGQPPKTTLATQALALSRRRRGPAYVRFQ
jgi:hypothetical protein